jgi:hypothetical protein
MLIIVSGLPGTGKTTFARALAERLKVPHLNSDIIRDELDKRGQYDPETKEIIYREMYERAAAILQKGETVIIDATFHKRAYREHYLKLTSTRGCPLKWIELRSDEKTIKQRVSQKRDYSEADFPVYQKIKKTYEALEIPHLTLSSDKFEVEEMLQQAELYLKEGNL